MAGRQRTLADYMGLDPKKPGERKRSKREGDVIEKPPTKKKKVEGERREKKRKKLELSSDSDSDDSLLAYVSKDYKKVLKSCEVVSKNRRVPLRRTRDTLDTDDLRKELDLSDSDSEYHNLIAMKDENVPKPRVRHTLNSLVKDLTQRAATSTERSELDRELTLDLHDNTKTNSSFSNIPGAEQLISTTKDRYKGTDLHWVDRYSLVHWSGPTKEHSNQCKPEEFIQGTQDWDECLCKFIKGALRTQSVEEFLDTVAIVCFDSSYWQLPVNMIRWMFQSGCVLVCFSTEESRSFFCHKYIVSLIEKQTSVLEPFIFPSLSFKPNKIATECKPAWLPPFDTLLNNFNLYGCPIEAPTTYTSTPPKNAEFFPHTNFTLFLSIIELSIQNSCADNYTKEQIFQLFLLVSGFLIDPIFQSSTTLITIKSLFNTLLDHLPPDTFENAGGMKKLCDLLYGISDPPHNHHYVKLVSNFPLVSSRGNQTEVLRSNFSFYVLQRFFAIKTNIKLPNNEKEPLRIYPAQIQSIIQRVVQHVEKEKETAEDGLDYTNLYAFICLIDHAMDKNWLSKYENKAACQELRRALVDLNLVIPDASGIVIARTRVKEYISRLESNIMMVVAMGQAERTSKEDPTNNVITQFFRPRKSTRNQ